MNVRKTFTILSLLIIFVLFSYGVDLYSHVLVSRTLVEISEPFQFKNPSASTRILFAGDSTAVGTGATSPQNSIAGYFHRDFPNTEIINIAENGAKIQEVVTQLEEVEGSFDLVVVQAGANDILHFTPRGTLKRGVRNLLLIAKEKADVVVFLTGGNLGLAPIFVQPLDTIYNLRARDTLDIIEPLATEVGAVFVDLYLSEDDPIIEELDRYYAPDRLHLNDEGYAVWYKYIRATISEEGIDI